MFHMQKLDDKKEANKASNCVQFYAAWKKNPLDFSNEIYLYFNRKKNNNVGWFLFEMALFQLWFAYHSHYSYSIAESERAMFDDNDKILIDQLVTIIIWYELLLQEAYIQR